MPDEEREPLQPLPDIVRKISPQECQQLIEFLLAGPLKRVASNAEHEVVDNPTEEQLRQEHVKLSGGRIMLVHGRNKLHFETDWRPRGEYEVPDHRAVIYMGAVSDGRLHEGGTCRERWQAILEEDDPHHAEAPTQERPEVKWGSFSRDFQRGEIEVVKVTKIEE